MSASDSLYRGYGKLSLPLASAADSDLSSLDPARDILLELFAAALIAELLPRWSYAVSDTTFWDKPPVATKFPVFPDQVFLSQVDTDWPLLSVYRSETPEQFDEHTLWEQRVTCRWGADYCLGPLTVGNSARLADVLRAVPRILENVIREGGHVAYAADGYGNSRFAKRVLGQGSGCCGFSTIRVVESISGSAAFAQGGPKYHCASIVLETTELSTMNPAVVPPYQGTSVTLSTGDFTGIAPVVIADSAIPVR